MFRYIYAILIIFILAMPVVSQDKKEKDSSMNLDLIADDFKFGNAMQFIKMERFVRGLEELQEYLEIYTEGRHRYEAYREIEIIFFDKFNYLAAIKINKKIYEEFGKSEEGVSAFYRIGICFNKMGYSEDSVNTFKRIISEHPESIYAESAMTQIELLTILEDK